MRLFARITKYDEATGILHGRAVQEVADRSSEIFDYATSKPYFQSWSSDVAKASDGKSVGNVRAMHGNVAAGKLTALEFNDAEKAIDVTAHIVDTNEREKCAKGVYTGFSIGGKYVNKWNDPADAKLTRYTANPSEISIVDVPCISTATFIVTKADGSNEIRKFITVADDDMQKGMSHLAQLAWTLKDIGYLTDDQYAEAAREGDGSDLPDKLKDWLAQGAAILVEMAAEEAAELVAPSPGNPDTIADEGTLKSVEDNMSTPNPELKKAADDLTKAQLDLAKVTTERDAALVKAADLQKSLDDANTTVAAQDDLIAKATATLTANAEVIKANNIAIAALKAAPAPVRAALTAVAKGADVIEPAAEDQHVVKNADGSVNPSLSALSKALANPVMVG
jgi:hypothetical protein